MKSMGGIVDSSKKLDEMNNAEFTKIILSKMYNVLRPLGYRKRGQLFEKENSELAYLVGLQKSIYNTQ